MKIIRNILLLLCLLASFAIGKNPFFIHLRFYCGPQVGPWCGTLFVYVWNFLGDHKLKVSDRFCTTGDIKKLDYDIYYEGKTEYMRYNWNYMLGHNCSSDGQKYCLHPNKTVSSPMKPLSDVYFEAEVLDAEHLDNECDDPSKYPSSD
ncbi:hypothetical protein CRE_23004 [Caenorhabditis remanei]|uniref:Uncharacterized protein n=1 Tax=Caenorhabditis remanei TaxID=31234 RepID=E3N4F4_CAERE|nr:hypothetical protein CRE_23004 [Caenorhabditis remanei]